MSLAPSATSIIGHYVDTFQGIVDDYNQRLERVKTDHRVLDQGFWYANDYYKALVHHHQQRRITTFLEGDASFGIARNSFYYGHVNRKHFVHVIDPENESLCLYRLKKQPGTTPSKGLDSIRTKVGFIDCQEALEIAQYATLQHFMGKERFDDKFAADGASPMVFDTDIAKTPLLEFSTPFLYVDEEGMFIDEQALQVGDTVFIRNREFYHVKHPNGELGGDNMLCILARPNEERRYISLGVTNREGLNTIQVYQRFIDDYNEKEGLSKAVVTPDLWCRIESGIRPEYRAFLRSNPNNQMTMAHLFTCIQQTRHSHESRVGHSGVGLRFEPSAVEKYIP